MENGNCHMTTVALGFPNQIFTGQVANIWPGTRLSTTLQTCSRALDCVDYRTQIHRSKFEFAHCVPARVHTRFSSLTCGASASAARRQYKSALNTTCEKIFKKLENFQAKSQWVTDTKNSQLTRITPQSLSDESCGKQERRGLQRA